MPSGPAYPPYDTIARKWFGLAVRRRDYFIELMNSGRWARYYDEERFALRMYDVLQAVEIWRALAGVPPEAQDSELDSELRPAA